MKKQKPQKKADSQSKPNTGRDNQEERGWRYVLVWVVPVAIGFVLAAISIIWVSHQWLAIIAAIGAAITFLAYLLFLAEWHVWPDRRQRERMRLVFGGLSLVVAMAGAFWVYHIWTNAPQPFLAKIPAMPVGGYKSERGGVFWAIYNRGNGDIVTPAQLGLYIEIISQLSKQAVIDSYTVEAQNKSREWFKLIRVDASSSPVFICIEGGDLHKAKPLDLSNGLDRQLRENPIAAYATIKGWAFFELPQDIREGSPFRVTMQDNAGNVGQATESENAPPVKDFVQSADLHLAAGLKDLTPYRSMRYSELFPERKPN